MRLPLKSILAELVRTQAMIGNHTGSTLASVELHASLVPHKLARCHRRCPIGHKYRSRRLSLPKQGQFFRGNS